MSEVIESPEVPPEMGTSENSRLIRFAGIAAPLLLLAGLLLLGHLTFMGRSHKLLRRIAELESSRRERPRRLPFGPPLAGNAALDYLAIEWALAPRRRWTEAPAGMTMTLFSRDDPDAQSLDLAGLLKTNEYLDAGEPWPKAISAAVTRYAPLGELVMRALRRERCDWPAKILELELDSGPSYMAYNRIGRIMLLDASRRPLPEAVERNLAVVALGTDLARHPNLIGVLSGIALQGVGYEGLLRLLRRPLKPKELERIIAVLAELPAPSLALSLLIEPVIAHLSMIRRGDLRVPIDGNVESPGQYLNQAGVLFLGWGKDDELGAENQAIVKAPPWKRAALQAKAVAKRESSFSLITRFLGPDWSSAAEAIDEARVCRGNLIALAAARLQQQRTGALPDSPSQIAATLGKRSGWLRDPFSRSGGQLQLGRSGSDIIVYSVYVNGADDQGRPYPEIRDKGADLVYGLPMATSPAPTAKTPINEQKARTGR